MGQKTREFSKVIIDDLDLPLTVDEFIKDTKEIFDELFPDCTVLSGKTKYLFTPIYFCANRQRLVVVPTPPLDEPTKL